MLRLIWTLSIHARCFLRRYIPTNRLLDAIRTRRGLKWGIPAMLLAIPFSSPQRSSGASLKEAGPDGCTFWYSCASGTP